MVLVGIAPDLPVGAFLVAMVTALGQTGRLLQVLLQTAAGL